MSKTLLSFLLLCFTILNTLAQDTLPPTSTFVKLKYGMYADWNAVINNRPFRTDSFRVIAKYAVNQKQDTILLGYNYEFSDPGLKSNVPFGFFDGKNLYLDNPVSKGTIKVTVTHMFYPLEYFGRFAFTTINQKITYILAGPGATGIISGIVGVADALMTRPKDVVYYVGRKGDFSEATPQAISFLIHKEKDLKKEYAAEKNKTNINTVKKYLIKMSERYPL